MTCLKSLATVLCALLLSACAGGPPPMQPPQPRPVGLVPHVLSRSAQVDQTSHVSGHLDDDRRIVYFQTEGGGGVGLGLLLGPLGVMANVSLIEARTKADIDQMRGKLGIDVKSAFVQAAANAGFALGDSANASQPRITPYLHVRKLEGDTLRVSAAILVEQGEGAQKWTGRYVFELPGLHSLAALSSTDTQRATGMATAVGEGYVRLLRRLVAESPQQLAKERLIDFKVGWQPPAYGFERQGMLVAEEQDVVWIRLPEGIHALRRETVKYTLRPT
ncbi:MAG: hypothetical protein JWQ76_3306 [Ramlibacter sp.]|nr:hypothetical protein [Ramlibacter sp.]